MTHFVWLNTQPAAPFAYGHTHVEAFDNALAVICQQRFLTSRDKLTIARLPDATDQDVNKVTTAIDTVYAEQGLYL